MAGHAGRGNPGVPGISGQPPGFSPAGRSFSPACGSGIPQRDLAPGGLSTAGARLTAG